MRIRVRVDRRAALRQGRETRARYHDLDVDVAALSAAECELLAALVQETEDELCLRELILQADDMHALRAALAAELERRRQRAEEDAGDRIIARGRIRESVTAALADAAREQLTVHLREDGERTTWSEYAIVSRVIDVPERPYVPAAEEGRVRVEPSDDPRYEEARARISAERARLIEQAIEELRAELPAELERRRQRKAEQEQAYAALYARLPAELRARHEAGYARRETVEREMIRLVLADAGYDRPPQPGWADSCPPDELTPGEYLAYTAEVRRAPAGAQVVPLRVWSYRPAEDDEEGDRDGEVRCDERLLALITWSVAGLQARTTVELSS